MLGNEENPGIMIYTLKELFREIKLNKQKNINKQLIEMMKEKEKNGEDNKKLKRKRI